MVRARVGLLLLLLAGLAIGGLLLRAASATVLREVAFEAQSASADRIFVGTVRSVESRPNPAAPRYLETLVAFAVEEIIAGDVASPLTLRFSGGQLGDVRQSVDGLPELAVGERYVVFLERDQEPPLVSPVVGFNQGLYRVVEEGGRSVVRDRLGRPLPAGSGARAAATAALTASPESAESEPSLDRFLEAVRAARR